VEEEGPNGKNEWRCEVEEGACVAGRAWVGLMSEGVLREWMENGEGPNFIWLKKEVKGLFSAKTTQG